MSTALAKYIDAPLPQPINKGGRPAKYQTAEELQAQVDDYYIWCAELGQVANVAGLAKHLGYSDRASVYDLEAHPKFSHVIKYARLAIESNLVSGLCSGKGWGPGRIFILKNHHGYRDEKHIQQTTRSLSDGPELVSEITRLLRETKLIPQDVVVEADDNQEPGVINMDNTVKSIGYDDE